MPSSKILPYPLVVDLDGQRLAKRHQSLSLKALREAGENRTLCGQLKLGGLV